MSVPCTAVFVPRLTNKGGAQATEHNSSNVRFISKVAEKYLSTQIFALSFEILRVKYIELCSKNAHRYLILA